MNNNKYQYNDSGEVWAAKSKTFAKNVIGFVIIFGIMFAVSAAALLVG